MNGRAFRGCAVVVWDRKRVFGLMVGDGADEGKMVVLGRKV